MKEPTHFVLAYYRFTPIADPHEEVRAHKNFFKGRDITSRIYISEQGINGQMSGTREAAESYMQWLHQRAPFAGISFKIHPYHENVFPRQTVKYRKQLVALDEEVDLEQTGQHISPKEWREKLESPEKPLLLDVRNDYEWEVGRFEGSVCPPCETFRDFKGYAEELAKEVDPSTTPVMMCCTGGIRCELYSSLLVKKGFKQVFQLNGGIIQYGLDEGNAHWLGKLFVFDDRLTVPIAEGETPVIGQCHHCQAPSEAYYNCANMDCNTLYLCCPDCLHKTKGCCQTSCQEAPRLRPYHAQEAHKPFRKKHLVGT